MFRQKLCLVVVLLAHISGIWCAAARNESFIQSRIKHGTGVDIKDTPYQVSLRAKALEEQKYGSGFICGGSLISKNVVLTAKHCFFIDMPLMNKYDAEEYVIVMGNSNYMEHDEFTLKYNIKEFVNAKSSGMENDITLVFLDDNVPENHPTAKPIPLNKGPLKNGAICQAYGWGMDASDKLSELLQTVNLPVMTTKVCEDETDYYDDIRNGMICAGYLEGGPSACKGDSGGPLVCGGVLVGINSWSHGCGRPMKPNVFTEVALYISWIEKHIDMNKGAQPTFKNV